MKKIKLFVFALVVFMASSGLVYAACDVNEMNNLNNLAVNVKASYEAAQIELEKDEFFNPPDGMTDEEIEEYISYKNVFNIYIENITEDLYVTVYDKLSNQTVTYNYEDSDNGSIKIVQEDVMTMNTYTIVVYSSSKTGCPDTKLYTLSLVTPYYNELSEYALCEGAEEYYLCHEYLTVDNVTFDKFVELVTQYKESKSNVNEEEEDKNNDFIENNKGVVIGTIVGVIIVVGGAVAVVIVKKQRSKVV